MVTDSISCPVPRNEQPTPADAMPRNLQALAAFRDADFNEDDRVRPISERPPSLTIPDLGEPSLMGKLALHGRRNSSTTLLKALTSPKRISIGQPLNFRRLDYTEKQRSSLMPLQLEPVVLRTDGNSEDTLVPKGDSSFSLPADLPVDTLDPSYRQSRESPWQRCQHTIAVAHEVAPAEPKEERNRMSEIAKSQQTARPPLSTQSSSSSMRSLRRLTQDINASGNTVASRASVERGRLKRKRSNQFSSSDIHDLDREILELNTIVEERRIEAPRPQSPGHIPAVAPHMAVRARSETLTSIGSAFSRPLRLDTTCQTIHESASPMKSPIKSRLSRPFTNMPDPTVTEEDNGVVRRPSSRVTGWLSGLLKDSTSTTAHPSTSIQFYACSPRVSGRKASESSLVETGSPCLTTTSSPVCKTHSRSLTSDSRVTTMSPPSTACASEFDGRDKESRKKTEDQWRGIDDHLSQVGLAM